MRIGVIGVQGDVSEHVDAVARAMREAGKSGEAITVRRPNDLARVDGLTIPGGESTTISKLLVKLGLFDEIVRRATAEAMPIMGTCAGCILLSKDAGMQAEKTKTKLLGLMDMSVDRNAFGRQRESFEADLTVDGLDRPFHCVFIRAPAILRTWGSCEPLSRYQDRIVLARQGNLIGVAFHPELSGDLRIHRWFLDLV
ncbi:MAG: pyridoxal 5'-phosphate synthase glutaminase subunit PdxT [Thermoplasmata archaeon]